MRVAIAGKAKWIADTLPKLDRRQDMTDDGIPMTDAQMSGFLGHAYESIATDGANKVTPGAYSGTGARANRGSASRALHFADADSYTAYQSLYGEKTIQQVMNNHPLAIGKGLALVEAFGTNALPAGAGMDRPGQAQGLPLRGVPRRCGGEPSRGDR